MTYLAKDISDHLKGSAAITNVFSYRIFPENVPQEFRDGTGNIANPYPCIVLNDISKQPEYYLGGEAGIHTSVMQVDVWTDGTGGPQRANEYAELIRNRLNGYRGQFGTGEYGTARMISSSTPTTQPTDATDNWRRRVSMDFEIIHSASVPTFA